MQTFAITDETGAPSSTLLVKSEERTELPQNPESFVEGFKTWMKNNSGFLDARGTKIIRIVQDQNGTIFSETQKKEMTLAAKQNGYTLRFESVTIDYRRREQEAEARRIDSARRRIRDAAAIELDRRLTAALDELRAEGRNLEEVRAEAAAAIENKIVEEFFSGPEAQAISTVERDAIRGRIRSFFLDVYEKPTPLEFRTGLFKGGSAALATVIAWNRLGVSPSSPVFYALTAKLLAQETLFGPYIKTYLNFLKRKIEANVGALGTALYGHAQGFVLFSFDKLLLHLFDPAHQTGPWDPTYLLGYVSITGVGALFGSTGPVGINTLVSKGYMSLAAGGVLMQFLDLVMPIEGALLTMGNPLLFPLFITHQAVKFSIFLVSKLLPMRPMVTLVPGALANDPQINSAYGFDKIPADGVLNDVDQFRALLVNESVSPAYKLGLLKFMLKAYEKNRLSLEKLKMVTGVYAELLRATRFGGRVAAELKRLNIQYRSLTEESMGSGRIEAAGDGRSPRVKLSLLRKQIREQAKSLRARLVAEKEMARLILVARDHFQLSRADRIVMGLESLANIPVPPKLTMIRMAWEQCMTLLSGAAKE